MESLQQTKLNPSQAKVEAGGHHWKHVVVSLRNAQTIAEVRETPGMWSSIQHDLTVKLSRGDEVSLVAPDGLTIADRCRVLKAEAGNVYLGKPLRLVEMEEVGLYEDQTHRVVPNGTGYSIQATRDNRTDERIYPSVEAAKIEIVKRAPSRAA